LNPYLPLLPPICGLIINAVCQVLYCRLSSDQKKIQLSVLMGFGTGFISIVPFQYLFAWTQYSFLNLCFLLLTNIIIYLGLSFCYFGVIGLGLSLRIRIMDIISKSPMQPSYKYLSDKFNSLSLFERRLERLINGGQIREIGGNLYSRDSLFMRLALLNAIFKKFLTGKKSEFD
jgi:hypothetical protein